MFSLKDCSKDYAVKLNKTVSFIFINMERSQLARLRKNELLDVCVERQNKIEYLESHRQTLTGECNRLQSRLNYVSFNYRRAKNWIENATAVLDRHHDRGYTPFEEKDSSSGSSQSQSQ